MSLFIRDWQDNRLRLSIQDGIWHEPGSEPELDLTRFWALPGLADCHAHLAVDSLRDVTEAGELEGVKRRAFAQLESGVFLVVDKGWSDDVVLRLTDSPPPTRPEFGGAGRIISGPDGYFPGFAVEVSDQELMAAIKGADPRGGWVKLIGDWPQKGRGPVINFTEQALSEACDLAHELGLKVAIHTMAADTPGMAVRAGCDSIEHGLYLCEEDLAVLGKRSGAWVPTVCNIEDVMSGFGSGSTAARILGAGLANIRHRLPEAAEMGVLVMTGTDLGLPHGQVAKEAVRLHDYGLSGVETVKAAGPNAYRYLDLPGLALGASADLVLFDTDPVIDLDTLTRPILGIRAGRTVFDRLGVLEESRAV